MESKLAGRVAIVTGGGSGIGRATSHALARQGAAVVVADLNPAGASSVAKEIEGDGGRALPHACDVSDEDSVRGMVAAAVDTYGGLDILHNNAAASDPDLMGRDGAVTDMEVEVWDATLAVNLRGPMLGCKHGIPEMLKRGGGAIINTSSASGLVGDIARPAYGASKAGVDSLTRYVATQYGKRSIRCNAIAPGVIFTPALEANVPKQQIELYAGNHLTPRLGKPEDIAGMVVFLASDDGAYVTGQILSVDGGLLAHHPTFAEFSKLEG
jgi:NAD(P)-dependent dehydrogenase (short-subunit alcohol dehydrogenase family)